MLQAIKTILGSKKFWLNIGGNAFCAALIYFHAPQSWVVIAASLFGINVIAQGIADHGKESAQIQADAFKASLQPPKAPLYPKAVK